MEKQKIPAIISFVMVLTCGCSDNNDDKTLLFNHDSPRPQCRYSADPGRVPYYSEPAVVATDWGEPVRLAGPLTDQCPNDAVEISQYGKTIYFFWSPTVEGTNEELLHIHTGTYYAERVGDDPGMFTNPRFFDLQKGAEGGFVYGSIMYFVHVLVDDEGVFGSDIWYVRCTEHK